MEYRPIGIIRSPFDQPEGTPIQPSGAKGVEGFAEIFPEYSEGLEDLDGFSHIILLFHCHLAKPFSLKVKPFLDDAFHGVFATRAPARPNAIGLSVVRLLEVGKRGLRIQDVDIVDGTPLLDVKPYVPQFDIRDADRIGWLEAQVGQIEKMEDDGRFSDR